MVGGSCSTHGGHERRVRHCRLNRRGLIVEDLGARWEVNVDRDGNAISNYGQVL